MQVLAEISNSIAPPSDKSQFTVGKIDAGMAVLLTCENQQIEFPSILLPEGVKTGSVVCINVTRDTVQEVSRKVNFDKLQDAIFLEFGSFVQQPPVLSIRSTTQTSCIIEWSKLDIGKDRLLGLHLFKNNQRLPLNLPKTLKSANINNYVKVSGLELNLEYEFSLEMKTSSGTFWSDAVKVKTHSLDNLTGIVVAFGQFEDASNSNLNPDDLENASITKRSSTAGKCAEVIEKVGGKWSTQIDINVTHFICQIPAGPQYDLATAYNIPIVKPEWIFACEADRKLQPALAYYLSR
ncbi:Chitin biosynthesis protein CHS5 [Smittium culicis]|uniref:Chitin biosynthesis protein CHS5 n=1 Tax=Smittium culicis TaxID=133412 RepID=A0A1R1YQJ3_9FUNG|nr:Chitin biosynthesis protein CHS5 [Smittium culicis]